MTQPTRSIECEFLAGLRQILGPATGTIALHEPEFSGNEWKMVKDTLDSTFVSSVGKYVDEFEDRLAAFTGAKHAIVVANGTVALQIALTLAGVRAGDEVIVPALSFVATANAVVHAGGVPHFVDSDPISLGIDSQSLAEHLMHSAEMTSAGLRNKRTGRRIAAIVPMHTFGHPVDLDPLLDLAERLKLPIVEDAAEALGSRYKGRHAGTFGLVGTLSFNGNKIITTGGGGAILTNDTDIARRAKHLTTTAKRRHQWEFFHDEVAWNFRMPNINAALGCAQMERLPALLDNKRRLAARYREVFSKIAGVEFVSEPPNSESNYWLMTIKLFKPEIAIRDTILKAANEAGYQCRPVWTLLHRLPMYDTAPHASLKISEKLEAALINVPSSPKLGAF